MRNQISSSWTRARVYENESESDSKQDGRRYSESESDRKQDGRRYGIRITRRFKMAAALSLFAV